VDVLVTKSSARAGKSFALVDNSMAAYASGRRGNVAPNSNESLEAFHSSCGSLYDEDTYLAGLRLGFGLFGSEASQYWR